MLKEQDIKQYLNEKDSTFKENTSIIGVIFPRACLKIAAN